MAVGPVDGRGVDPDEDLVLVGDGPIHLFEMQNIGWGVITFGGVCTLALALLFYLENTGIQIAMIAILAVLISSLFFLLIVLDHPYSGGYSISPDALRVGLEGMRPWGDRRPSPSVEPPL